MANENVEDAVVNAVASALQTRRRTGSSRVFAGVASPRGMLSRESLEAGGLRVEKSTSRDGDQYMIRLSASPQSAVDAMGQSQFLSALADTMSQEHDVSFGRDVVQSPYNYDLIYRLLAENTIHEACIETKADDYAYNGWYLEETQETHDALQDRSLSEDVVAEARTEAEAFLRSCLLPLGITSQQGGIDMVCRDLSIEYEALGMAAFEILRDSQGFIRKCRPLPFKMLRAVNQSISERQYGGFVTLKQRSRSAGGAGGVYFVRSWSVVTTLNTSGAEFDPREAEAEEFPEYSRRAEHLKWREDALRNPTDPSKTASSWEDAATEVYVLARRPFTRSEVYGTPSGYSAMRVMQAQIEIEKYNLQFFATKGVPHYAVIVEGLGGEEESIPIAPDVVQQGGIDADVDDPEEDLVEDDMAKLRAAVREFFTEQLKTAERSVLVLTTTGEAKVRFEKLASENIEAAFKEYDARCTERIRVANRIPGAAMGILETANLGAGRDTGQLRRYRDHVVAVGQRMLESVVSDLLKCGLLIPYFNFRFESMSLDDQNEDRTFALRAFQNGAYSLDMFLRTVGEPELGTPMANAFLVPRGEYIAIAEDDESPVSALASYIKSLKKEGRVKSAIADMLLNSIQTRTNGDRQDADDGDQ